MRKETIFKGLPVIIYIVVIFSLAFMFFGYYLFEHIILIDWIEYAGQMILAIFIFIIQIISVHTITTIIETKKNLKIH